MAQRRRGGFALIDGWMLITRRENGGGNARKLGRKIAGTQVWGAKNRRYWGRNGGGNGVGIYKWFIGNDLVKREGAGRVILEFIVF